MKKETLINLENGMSILPAYRVFKSDSKTYADLKVNLIFRKNQVVIHVAGSETEYTDLGPARAYVHRVQETIVGSVVDEPELAVAS